MQPFHTKNDNRRDIPQNIFIQSNQYFPVLYVFLAAPMTKKAKN